MMLRDFFRNYSHRTKQFLTVDDQIKDLSELHEEKNESHSYAFRDPTQILPIPRWDRRGIGSLPERSVPFALEEASQPLF